MPRRNGTVSRETFHAPDPTMGSAPSLHARLRMVLPTWFEKTIRIVANGRANPVGRGRAHAGSGRTPGLGDVFPLPSVSATYVRPGPQPNVEPAVIEKWRAAESILPEMISANAYLGADVMCEALNTHRRPIVLVRADFADPSLFLAPMMHEFGLGL